jgi:hypothetical protein
MDVRDLGSEALMRNPEHAAAMKELEELRALKGEKEAGDKRLAELEKTEKDRAAAERVERLKKHGEGGRAVLGDKYAEVYTKEVLEGLTCGDIERDCLAFDVRAGQTSGTPAPPVKGKADRTLAPPAGSPPPAGGDDLVDRAVVIGEGRDAMDIAYTSEGLQRKRLENMGLKPPDE